MPGTQQWASKDIAYILTRRAQGASYDTIAEEFQSANPRSRNPVKPSGVRYVYSKFKDSERFVWEEGAFVVNTTYDAKRKASDVESATVAHANMNAGIENSASISASNATRNPSGMAGHFSWSLQPVNIQGPPSTHLSKSPRNNAQIPIRYSPTLSQQPARDAQGALPLPEGVYPSPLQYINPQINMPMSSPRIAPAFQPNPATRQNFQMDPQSTSNNKQNSMHTTWFPNAANSLPRNPPNLRNSRVDQRLTSSNNQQIRNPMPPNSQQPGANFQPVQPVQPVQPYQYPVNGWRVPHTFFDDLDSGVFRGAYVFDAGNEPNIQKIIILWLIEPESKREHRHHLLDLTVPLSFAGLESYQQAYNGPFIAQYALNTSHIKFPWELPYEEDAKRELSLTEIFKEVDEKDFGSRPDVWLELKFQMDLKFGFLASCTSLWSHANLERPAAIMFTYYFCDGTPHTAGFRRQCDEHGTLSDQWFVVNYQQDHLTQRYHELTAMRPGGIPVKNAVYNFHRNYPELEVLDFVHETISLRMFGLRQPTLFDPTNNQVRALRQLVGQHYRENNFRGAVWNETTLGEEQYLDWEYAHHEIQREFHHPSMETHIIQLLFLLNWRLNVNQFNRIPGFQYCSRPRPDSCPLSVNGQSPCDKLRHKLELYEQQMMHEIYFQTLKWVMLNITDGCLGILEKINLNSRIRRMEMWCHLLAPSNLIAIFDILHPGINIPELVKNRTWAHYLRTIVIRLADTILLYQLAQFPRPGSRHIMEFSPKIYGYMFQIIRGFDLSRQTVIPPSCPPPVHPDLAGEIDISLIRKTHMYLVEDQDTWDYGEGYGRAGYGIVPSALLDDVAEDEGGEYVDEVKCEKEKLLDNDK